MSRTTSGLGSQVRDQLQRQLRRGEDYPSSTSVHSCGTLHKSGTWLRAITNGSFDLRSRASAIPRASFGATVWGENLSSKR